MRVLYYILLYVIFAWGQEVWSVYLTSNPRIYLVDPIVFFFAFSGFLKVIGGRHAIRDLKYYFCAVALLVGLGVYSGRVLGNSMSDVAGQMRVFLLYSSLVIASYAFLKRPSDAKWILRILIVSAITVLFKGAFRLVSGTGYLYSRFAQNQGDVTRFFSYFEGAVLSFIFYLYLARLADERRRVRTVELALPVLVVVALLLSNYRSVWLSVVIVTAGFVAWRMQMKVRRSALRRDAKGRRSKGARVTRVVLFSGAVALLVVVFISNVYLRFVDAKLNQGNLRGATEGRLLMWSEALRRIQKHPFFGEGVGYFTLFQGHIATLHNDLLQFVQTFGLLGGSILLGILFLLARKPGHRGMSSEEVGVYPRLRTAFGMTFAGIVVVSLFEPFVLQPPTVAMVFAVLGFVIRADRSAMRLQSDVASRGLEWRWGAAVEPDVDRVRGAFKGR